MPLGSRRKGALWPRRLAGLTCLVMCCVAASPAGAWEFSLSGVFTWEFYQFSQLSDKGFFGPFNQDKSSAKAADANLSARNGWLGNEITRDELDFENLVSGSDAAANYIHTTLSPKLRVNEALVIEGSYRIGSWTNPSQPFSPGQINSSRYLNSQAMGIERSFSPGYWNLWFATARLPWGAIIIGKSPNTIGLGLIIDTSENTNEAVTVVAPLGPFYIGGLYYPWAPGRFVNYPVKTDRNAASLPHLAAFLLYYAGNISSATYFEYMNGHQGPESQPESSGTINFNPQDNTTFFGFSNVRYTDGRFFFNAEAGFHQDYLRQSRSQSNAKLPQTRYWEFWGGMTEFGVLTGPAKISFLWVYYPGLDRRGGKLIDRQPCVPGPIMDSGVKVYKPYSLLLGYNYGSGNHSIAVSCNHGFISDASTYAVRFDYAIAANLNAYASLLYAHRLSQGYGWGWIRPNPDTPKSPVLQYIVEGPTEFLESVGAKDAPNILERDLGYEIGGGIDWKLIEGYTLTARVAYWKPGAWFRYACVDRTQLNWNEPTASNMWGINPNREIAPIFGTRVAIQMDF